MKADEKPIPDFIHNGLLESAKLDKIHKSLSAKPENPRNQNHENHTP